MWQLPYRHRFYTRYAFCSYWNKIFQNQFVSGRSYIVGREIGEGGGGVGPSKNVLLERGDEPEKGLM